MVLDTCSLIWLASDQSRFSKNALHLIEKSAGNLYISGISSFEIALKAKKNLIKLPLPVEDWFQQVLAHHGITEIAINSKIAIQAVKLRDLHKDPADRIIIATAKLYNMPILTPDHLISQYEEVPIIW